MILPSAAAAIGMSSALACVYVPTNLAATGQDISALDDCAGVPRLFSDGKSPASDYIQRFSLSLSGGGIGETTNAHPPQGLGAESSDADIEALHREVFGDTLR
jgi:hypothetical protein